MTVYMKYMPSRIRKELDSGATALHKSTREITFRLDTQTRLRINKCTILGCLLNQFVHKLIHASKDVKRKTEVRMKQNSEDIQASRK